MIRVLLYREAQRDIEEIEAYFDANAPAQTERFFNDLEAAITAIAEHPLLRFAVLHHSRGPRALEERL